MVIIGQKTLREKNGLDVISKQNASVKKSRGREDGVELHITDGAVGEPDARDVLGMAIAITAFGTAATRQVTWTMTSHLRCCLNDPRCSRIPRVKCKTVWVRWRRRSMTLLTLAFCRNVPRYCAILFCARIHDVFRRALLGDPPARVYPMKMQL